jgi:hypothetical protein
VRPELDNIAIPPLPPRVRWLNTDRPPQLAELTAGGPVLVHFFDFAQLNSVRALPYAIAWDRRYRAAGLAMLGVHSPRFRFTADREALAAALARLGVEHPVADDSGYALWHDYGCEGWPSLFVWGQGGALRWFAFGEGDYAGTEAAIVEELAFVDPSYEPPPPLEPLRPSDAPGALVMAPTDEVFPGGSATDPWRSEDGALELTYEAGGAHATVAGTGELRAALDGGPERTISIAAPGLYNLAEHDRHERHQLRVEAAGGLELYSLSFSAGVP